MKILEKRLGRYLLIELSQDGEGNETITLYKKWSKLEGYEATEYSVTFSKEERERALNRFNMINLKNVYEMFNR